MKFYMGVDGGGTTTRCVVIDREGNITGYGKAGPANYHAAGSVATRENLLTSIQTACATLPLNYEIESIFLALAGVVSDKDKAVILELSRAFLQDFKINPENIHVSHDCQAALAGATGCAEGIIVISGTGSSCYGQTRCGTSWMAGGWGYLLDDLGSSYYLGQQALVSCVQAYDGRGPSTMLLGEIIQVLGISKVEELLNWLYYPQPDRAAVAGLAPLVIQAAEAADEIARTIVNNGARELAVMVKAVAEKLKMRSAEIKVATAGGLLNTAYYRRAFQSDLQKVLPNTVIISPLLSPVIGAALLGYQLSIGEISPGLLAKLALQQIGLHD